MAEEQDDKVASFLSDLEAEITERRAERLLKKIKKGRAVIFIIALLNMAVLVRWLDTYDQNKERIIMAVAMAVFYFVLFILSSKKTYISLLTATIAYLVVGVYGVITDLSMFRFVLSEEITAMQRSAFAIAILVKLIIFYFLIVGTSAAKKFDALYAEG